MMDGQKDAQFPVNFYRNRGANPPPSTKQMPFLPQNLGELNPGSIIGTLRTPGSLARQSQDGSKQETKRFVSEEDYEITTFFIRKPIALSSTPAHWAMFFKVDRSGKSAEKWIKVDLISIEYRVIYHTNIAPQPGSEGTDEHYSVKGLKVSLLYQLLSTVAKEKGKHVPMKQTKYDCQDFADEMLRRLSQYDLKQTDPASFKGL
jgi:hypothetical protein